METVRGFRILLADGELVTCSRNENRDLFRAAIGGYGLLGILVDIDLDAVPNVSLRPTIRDFPAASAGPALAEAVAEAMKQLTESLIDEALALGGSFYMPCRLHARPDQVRRAYPGLDAFAAIKRNYDPRSRFRNALLDTYLGGSGP